MQFRIIIFIFLFVFGSSMFLQPQELGPWERVDPGSGFGDINNWGVYSMAVYNGHLYVGTGYNYTNGFEVWRYDGLNWTRVATGGLGDSNECSAWSMAVYEGKLYVGGGGEVNQVVNQSRVYAYDGTTWTQVNTFGFDADPYNLSVRSLQVWNSRLYAGVYNDEDGCQVWEYDGSSWTQVARDGFDYWGYWSPDVRSMTVYEGQLVAGTVNYYYGGEVLAYNDTPVSWEWIGYYGLDYGANWNMVIRDLAVFENQLYAATASPYGTQIYRYDGNPDYWTQVNTSGFGLGARAAHSLRVYAGRLFAGVEGFNTTPVGITVWEYNDGSTWNRVNEFGFGDPENSSLHAMAVFQNKLYAGTSHNSGCQVWRAAYCYPVRASVSGGNGTVSPASQLVDLGADGLININPDPGYRIDTITDNGQSVAPANPYLVTNVRDNHNVVVTFTRSSYPPDISLGAVRQTEQAWIIRKDYGEISISITEHPTDPMPVARYILYRIEGGGMTQLAEYTTPGSHTHIDKYLNSGASYGYQVVAVDAAGTVVAQSEIVTI